MSYYRFKNQTKCIFDKNQDFINIQSIGILSLFDTIITANNWDSYDEIIALPRNYKHPILIYWNGNLTMDFEEIKELEVIEEKEINCTWCGDILKNHLYGNICGKHTPSYALWDEHDTQSDDEMSEYEYNKHEDLHTQPDDEMSEYEFNDYDQLYDDYQSQGYECECYEESGY
jgi:hypothetical protein